MRARLPLFALLTSAILLPATGCGVDTQGEAAAAGGNAGRGGLGGAAGRGGKSASAGKGGSQAAGKGGASPKGADPVIVGLPDRVATTSVVVPESSLRASVVDGALHVQLRAQAQLGLAKGIFQVSLRSLDDAGGGAKIDVPYDVPTSGGKDLFVVVPLPDDLVTQQQRVLHNVLIEGDGVRVTRSLFSLLSVREVTLEAPVSVTAGKTTKVVARVRHPVTREPLAGAAISLEVRLAGASVESLTATADDQGAAVFDLALSATGAHQLVATSSSEGQAVETTLPVTARAPGSKVLITTDKPIYQPGQAVHLRALALAEEGNTPLAGAPVLFEIKDGKGNKVFKRSLVSDAYGIAAATFRIGSIVNTGTYKISSLVAGQASERAFTVGTYALPKFRAVLTTDRAYYGPGDVVMATVDAAYFFGKLVSGGDVTIEAATLDVGQTVFQTVQGKLDANGRFAFTVQLPSTLAGIPLQDGKGLILLRAKVKDAAGQEVTKEVSLTVSQDGVDLALIPEATRLVPGLENRLDLYASDPLGAPLATTAVVIDAFGQARSLVTDADGHASLVVVPPGQPEPGEFGGSSVKVSLVTAAGKPITRSFSFGAQAGAEHVIARTDKSVYDVGETVTATLHATDPDGTIYVQWLAGGQLLDVATLKAKDGVATYTRLVDASYVGGNRLEAYVVDPKGNIVRTGRNVVVRTKGALSVAVDSGKPSYLPGEQATVTLTVTDEEGKPAAAALGVSVVDEAVFALVDARPGLLRTFFELDRAFAEPSYEIHGPVGGFEDLLFGSAKGAANDPEAQAKKQTKAAAALAALGNKSPSASSSTSWPFTVSAVRNLVGPYAAARREALRAPLTAVAKSTHAALSKEGCYPYGGTCAQPYAEAMQAALTPAVKSFDFWGNAYGVKVSSGSYVQLTSSGPDEVSGTADDHVLSFTSSDLGIPYQGGPNTGGPMPGGPGQGTAGGAGAGQGVGGGEFEDGDTAPPPGGSAASEPRVRKDFPETLYVNPAVITDGDGKATLSIPLADNITTWRVSALASSLSGRLGGEVGNVRVFTDFFTDISFPAELTRGDEVTFPIAVYNYLETPQTVTLELTGGEWYTPLGAQTFTVALAAGEVKGVSVPVRAEKVGVQTLTVKAKGDTRSDAVQRMVRVVPNGKAESQALSGTLAPGVTTRQVAFPAGAVPGSETLQLELYPTSFSQVVSGIDSVLRTPSGCFEQTTSTTWPNVLALKYLDATSQGTPAVRLKAESLINAGYQRLLTYEHPGGGFSWFGTQDKAPFLSVTAFGLMEFADMATVSDVDPAMIARTAQWLAKQQQDDGSWKGDQTEFFSVNASTVRNTAFVAWSLASAGYQGSEIDKGLSYVQANLAEGGAPGGDGYTLGVVANAFVAGRPNDPFTQQLLEKLDASKKVDGAKMSWSTGGTQTSFYEGGGGADLSATALAGHAFLSANAYPANVAGALGTIAGSRDPSGNFGATQSTVWSLRLLSLAATKGTESGAGTVEVAVDGAPFTTVSFSEADADVLRQVDLSALAKTGEHTIGLTFVGTGKPSYSLVAKHHIPWADVPTAPTGPLSVTVGYDRTALVVDETVKATVTITNLEKVSQNMVHATLGVPPGFEVLGEDFAPLLASGALSKWESTGKQLELYVGSLPPSGSLVVSYRLRATLPIKAEDGGAKVFPYYQPDAKSTAASTVLIVSAL